LVKALRQQVEVVNLVFVERLLVPDLELHELGEPLKPMVDLLI
jgi:hypothetical protein